MKMLNGITPDWGVGINAVFVVLGIVAGGALVFPGVPDTVVTFIKGYALDAVTIIAALNLVFHWFSSTNAGPGVITK